MKRLLSLLLSLVLLGAAAAAQTVENRLVDAVALYNDGQYASARTLLQGLTRLAPDNDAAYYYLGLCEAALRRPDEAAANLRQAIDRDPGNYWYRKALADIYLQKEEYDLVIQLEEALLRDFPDKTDAHYDLISLYLQTGQNEKALASLDAIETQMGPSDQVTRMRYEILRALGRHDEALQALEDYNSRFSSAAVLSMIGDYHMSEFRDTLALNCYQEALGLQSDYVPALLGLSEIYRQRRQYPDYFGTLQSLVGNPGVPASAKSMYLSNATRSLDPRFIRRFQDQFDSLMVAGLACHPGDSTLLQTAGLYYYSTDRRDKGRACFEENVRHNPDNLAAHASYVQALAYMEDWPALDTASREAQKLFPEENAFLEYNSIAAYNLHDYEAVLRNAETTLRMHPKDSALTLRALSTVGDMQHQLGRDKEAYKAYDKALKLNKDYAPVLNNYAWYLCQSGKQLRKAAQMSARTVELEPDNATYLDTYGWILHLQGKDSEAKTVFKHAMIYGGKESPVCLAHYAEVLYKLKEYDLAKFYWEQAIKINDGEVLNLEEKVKKKLEAVGKW